MERPSHIVFDRHSSLSRTPLLALAIGLQLVGAWLFTQGLVSGITRLGPPVFHFVPIKPEVLPRTPPPPLPKLPPIPLPKAPPPQFTIQSTPQTNGGITVTTNSPTQTTTAPPLTGVDRAAVGIAGTHTVPPYPPIARRLGVEGTATLRLTVGTDGRVSAAEIVTSAGREDMDQAARDWILAHWRYRPALRDGNPAPVLLLASVIFSLKNQP